jgi:hypothetical protein
MLKIVSFVVSGIFSCIVGFYFVYLYMITKDEGSSPAILVPTGFLVIVGVYCFFQVFSMLRKKDIDSLALELEPSGSQGGESIIEKNNSLAGEWEKMNKSRDRLKLLKIAEAGEEKK